MEKMIREQCANLPAALAWYLLSMLINSRLLCNFNTVPWLVLSKRSVYAIPDFWSLVLEHVFSPVNFSNYIDGGLRIVQSAYLLRISLRQLHPVIHPHSIDLQYAVIYAPRTRVMDMFTKTSYGASIYFIAISGFANTTSINCTTTPYMCSK